MKAKGSFLCTLALIVFFAMSFPANAEKVLVKYGGPVDLTGFDCSFTSSSFVHRICYNSKNKYAVVLLQQTYYHYCNVPPSIIDQWLNAESKGRFFNTYIKGKYDCRLGGVPLKNP